MRLHALTSSIIFVSFIACSDNPPGGTPGPGPGDNNGNTGGGGFVASIVEPNGDVSLLTGTPLNLRARFENAGAAVTPEQVRWESSVFLGDTNPLTVTLAAGTHTITVSGTLGTLTASDRMGHAAIRASKFASSSPESVVART